MKKMIACVLAMLVLVGCVGSVSAEPHRLGIRYGERIAFPHDGEHCWNWKRNRNGRPVAVIRDGLRAYRGAPCRGELIARVRLPWRSHEDNVRVFAANDRVYVFTLRHD